VASGTLIAAASAAPAVSDIEYSPVKSAYPRGKCRFPIAGITTLPTRCRRAQTALKIRNPTWPPTANGRKRQPHREHDHGRGDQDVGPSAGSRGVAVPASGEATAPATT